MTKFVFWKGTHMKKLISLFMSMVLLFSVGAEAFASYPEEHTRSYEMGNCTVTYTVQNEWDSYRQIEMSVTNNGEETLRNWALKLDCSVRLRISGTPRYALMTERLSYYGTAGTTMK